MRSIIREPEFEEDLSALFEIPPEGDAFTEAAEIVLSTHPESGVPARIGGSIWTLQMPPVEEKTVYLYYTFDEATVWFLFLRAF